MCHTSAERFLTTSHLDKFTRDKHGTPKHTRSCAKQCVVLLSHQTIRFQVFCTLIDQLFSLFYMFEYDTQCVSWKEKIMNE